MTTSLNLGYLVFAVRKPQQWDNFCRDILGLPAGPANSDGSNGYRLDEACQRLIVEPGRADDLAALGFDCGDDAGLDTRLGHLRAAGVDAAPASAAQCQARHVRRMHALQDPAGNRIELYTGLQQAAQPFVSTAFPGGFRTGALGLGHAVLVSSKLGEMEQFYAELLGFGVTERLATRVGPIDVRGTFMHCNARHHSIAIFDLPLRKRMHHFMLQAGELRDVGSAFERIKQHKVPLSLDIGQHPVPDDTFSFYAATPSGFDFEIGAGTREINPAGWDVHHTSATSAWGHKPQLRLQLKMAANLVASKFAR